MKTFFISLVFVLTTIFCFGQVTTDKGYIGISLGPSFPTGDYASTDLDNENAGFAKGGAIFDFSFGYKLGKYFGIAAMLRGQSNPIDAVAIETASANSFPGIAWNVDADPWSLGGLMLGLYGSFPIGPGQTAFETRLLIGHMSVTLPEIMLTGSVNGITFRGISESKTAGGFAVLLGGNFRFNVGRKISLLAMLDLNLTSVEFENVFTYYSDGTADVHTFTQDFSMVNLGFGIAYRLGAF